METNISLKVQPNEVSKQYRELILQQTEQIKRHAIQYNIDYIPVDINLGFNQVLQPYLLKRSKLY